MEKENTSSKHSENKKANFKIIDINEIEGSTFKTKKKSFVSDINPHLIRRNIQKEQYIWFGVYDQLLRNKNLVNVIKKCRDTSLPLECAAIHLDRFQLSFCKTESAEVKAYIFENEGSVIFLKLYLITKEQLIDLLNHYFNLALNLEEIGYKKIFDHLNKPDSSFNLKEQTRNENIQDYTLLRCLGELDGIMIYSMSTDKKYNEMVIAPPETQYLRNIFQGLKKSFSPYSEFLLMYYLYRLDGVRSFYTINQLKECFFKNKISSSDTKLSSLSDLNEEINLTIENRQSENRYNLHTHELNSSPPKKNPGDNETVKCSTCNASPFVTTPEKDHLNQYSYIFDLHHLPIFDENTGEFFWTNNEANWKKARDSILNSEEMKIYNGKSLSLNHGSLMSMSSSFALPHNNMNSLNLNTNSNFNTLTNTESNKLDEDINNWTKFKTDGNSNTFAEELNNLLKDFEK
jgi:hypothetical protein